MRIINKKHYKYIFGPVPSRRLGMSLGIDMVSYKTCPFDCVYCECGKTTCKTKKRSEYIDADLIISELDNFLSNKPHIDVITFGGSGEPTLNSGLHKLIEYIKSRYPEYKTAILTNSSLLHQREVQESILSIDYTLPSLDALSQPVFEKINHPVPGISINTISHGLAEFAEIYKGILWIEIFIIPGINDTEKELNLFKNYLKRIKIDRVQLNTLDRPGTCSWVKHASEERLIQIAEYLKPLPIEIIARKIHPKKWGAINVQTADHIISILKRRPMTVEDISVSLSENINTIHSLLTNLIRDKKIFPETISKKIFYRSCNPSG